MSTDGGQNGAERGNGAGERHGGPGAASPTPEHVRAMASRVAEGGRVLRRLGPERIATAVGGAATLLAAPGGELGRDARRALPEATGLSPQMVDWALRTNVAPADTVAMRALARRLQPPTGRALAAPARLNVVVLAGNVFTASLRAMTWPLLAGAPVLAKASSHDNVFPRLLARALGHVDPEVAAGYEVLTFAGGAHELEDALFSQADVVSVYGSDATIAAIRARLPATTRFVAHGHGLGAIYVPSDALQNDDDARRIAESIALDVAAFDQRGCLSPHAVWVERSAPVGPRRLARLLADEGLAPLSRSLPRGSLPTETGAAQLQWRGVATARGELFEGDGYAVSYEGDAPMRLSPGYRNVSVLQCDGETDLGHRLAPLGTHLKAIGVAGDHAAHRRVAETLPAPLAPRISAVGEMQTPPVDALADGDSPWLGLTRWIELS